MSVSPQVVLLPKLRLQVTRRSCCCNGEHKSGAAGRCWGRRCSAQRHSVLVGWRCVPGSTPQAEPPAPAGMGERREAGKEGRKEKRGAMENLSEISRTRTVRCRQVVGMGAPARSRSRTAQLLTPRERVMPCNAKSICLSCSDMTTHAYKVVPGGKIPFPNKQLTLEISAPHGETGCWLAHELGFATVYLPSKHTNKRSIRIN